MKLNRYHKQAIVNAIMLELPKVDEEKLKDAGGDADRSLSSVMLQQHE